jgi:purine operon repressor
VRRNERLALISKILYENPNKVISLNYFTEKFGAAKSTISEDLNIIKNALHETQQGELSTIPGAAGGARYRVSKSSEEILEFLDKLSQILNDEKRIIPGGYIYMTDVIFSPEYSYKLGEIIGQIFIEKEPTCVLTVETKGIPIALMTARALSVPLVVARRDSRVTEGPSVNISYVSGSSRTIHNMSVPKRALSEKARVLIVDDFMKGGGTAQGMSELVEEFRAEVVGVAVLVATGTPREKMVKHFTPLLILNRIDPQKGIIDLQVGTPCFNNI